MLCITKWPFVFRRWKRGKVQPGTYEWAHQKAEHSDEYFAAYEAWREQSLKEQPLHVWGHLRVRNRSDPRPLPNIPRIAWWLRHRPETWRWWCTLRRRIRHTTRVWRE